MLIIIFTITINFVMKIKIIKNFKWQHYSEIQNTLNNFHAMQVLYNKTNTYLTLLKSLNTYLH